MRIWNTVVAVKQRVTYLRVIPRFHSNFSGTTAGHLFVRINTFYGNMYDFYDHNYLNYLK